MSVAVKDNVRGGEKRFEVSSGRGVAEVEVEGVCLPMLLSVVGNVSKRYASRNSIASMRAMMKGND